MKVNRLAWATLYFENGETVSIKTEAINFMDFSPLENHIQILNNYLINRNVSKFIVIEFNKNFVNKEYLFLEGMFGGMDNMLDEAIEQTFEHLRLHRDLTSIELLTENKEVIKINTPWGNGDTMRNPHMNFIEGKDTYTITFDATKKEELPPYPRSDDTKRDVVGIIHTEEQLDDIGMQVLESFIREEPDLEWD